VVLDYRNYSSGDNNNIFNIKKKIGVRMGQSIKYIMYSKKKV